MNQSTKRRTLFEELQGTTSEIINQVKRLIRKGNARRLMIEDKKGKVVFQMQLTAGLTGSALIAFISPFVAAIGFFAVVLSDMKVVIEKYPEEELQQDEYEVDAEVIEIKDEEDVEDEEESESDDEPKTDKTIGRNE